MRECCIQLFAQSMENCQFTYSLNWKFWKIHLLIYQIGNIRRLSFMLSKLRYYQIHLHFVKVKINTKLHLPLLPLPRIASNFPLTSFNVYKSLPITTFSWRNYSPSEYIQTNRHIWDYTSQRQRQIFPWIVLMSINAFKLHITNCARLVELIKNSNLLTSVPSLKYLWNKLLSVMQIWSRRNIWGWSYWFAL